MMLEFLRNYHLLYSLLIAAVSGSITMLCIPSIVHVARARHLYDDIGHFRKHHDHGIPRLGGVAIFVSLMITLLSFGVIDKSLSISFLLIACVILFAMGLKDDLSGVNSTTKFLIQSIVAAILVIPADIRISSMYGVLGVFQLPYIPSVLLSILLILLIVNSFNLIDGIDGLAAMTGILVNCTFAFLFFYMDQFELTGISLAMAGAILGFLRYNLTPAKIFMGDTGALLIGLISAVMALKFMELCNTDTTHAPVLSCSPALTFAILAGPVFDTIRVFILRISAGKSPFEADRNHIHHRLLSLGLGHIKASCLLSFLNLGTIGLVFLLRSLGNTLLMILIVSVFLLTNWSITLFLRRRERRYAESFMDHKA